MSHAHKQLQRALLQLATDLGLPLEVVTEKVAILGQSGAGKTYTAMRLAELLLEAGLQVVVLDLVGPWWGLRAGVDGKRAGLPILVIGGQHGDLPLSASAGAALARLLVERRLSAVLDLSELDPLEKAEFARTFALALFEAKKRHPSPIHLLLEEAHELLPEDPEGKVEVAMRAAWVRVCKLGRNYGIGWTLVSQEPQALSKRALGQVGTMIAMRTQGDYAQRVVLGWAKTYLRPQDLEELKTQLPAMETGEAFVASPFFLKVARRTRISKRVTYDSSRTPEIGEHLQAPAVLAPVEVQQLREQFKDLVEELEHEDPAALQRRVAKLEKELAEAKRAQPPPPPPAPAIPPGLRTTVQGALAGLSRVRGHFGEGVEGVERLLGAALQDLDDQRQGKLPLHTSAVDTAPGPAAPTSSSDELGEYSRELLRAAAGRHPMKFSWVQLATLAGRSHRSSTFQAARVELRRAGLVQEAGAGLWALTPLGLQVAGAEAIVPASPAALREKWLAVLPEYPSWLLKVLISEHPARLTRQELATKAGKSATSSTFQAAVVSLRKNGLVREEGGGLQASPDLF